MRYEEIPREVQVTKAKVATMKVYFPGGPPLREAPPNGLVAKAHVCCHNGMPLCPRHPYCPNCERGHTLACCPMVGPNRDG